MNNYEKTPSSNNSSEWDSLSEVEPRFELQNRVAAKFNNPKNKDTLMRAIKANLLAAGIATAAFMSEGKTSAPNSSHIAPPPDEPILHIESPDIDPSSLVHFSNEAAVVVPDVLKSIKGPETTDAPTDIPQLPDIDDLPLPETPYIDLNETPDIPPEF